MITSPLSSATKNPNPRANEYRPIVAPYFASGAVSAMRASEDVGPEQRRHHDHPEDAEDAVEHHGHPSDDVRHLPPQGLEQEEGEPDAPEQEADAHRSDFRLEQDPGEVRGGEPQDRGDDQPHG